MAPDPSDHTPGEAQTLRGVLREFERAGYTGQFGARAGALIRCFSCRLDFEAARADIEALRRLEGASDPDDMLAVVPLTCPKCQARGTLVLAYGPEAAIEDSEVLAALPDAEGAVTPDAPGTTPPPG